MLRVRHVIFGAVLLAGSFDPLFAQVPSAGSHQPRASIRAVRATSPPTIDGRLSDEVWTLGNPVTEFHQQDPAEGQPATERTSITVLYDDQAIYVGARLFDSQPGLVSRRLSSRDGNGDADYVAIYLDPLHDHVSGVAFRVSAANALEDRALYNDTWSDSNWDAVWHSAVTLDDEGWSAEIRIPLSQLRFLPNADHWGFNVERFIRRKNERDWLELVPKSESGVASRMAHLTGLDGFRPRRALELLPYTAARAEFVQPSSQGDPFNDGARAFGDVGLDLKWGLTSNLMLNGTVNPDFGQVEVDPAVVNLTQFETFFDEKRPFFLEGSQILESFGQPGSNSFWGFNSSDPQIFYSRRIGRAPQLGTDGDFDDAPSATTILGAAKLTGQTRSGWNLGFMNAVTGREVARVSTGGVFGETAVEPRTNYFLARMYRDIGSRSGAGLVATSVHRALDTFALSETLVRDAVVLGGDGYWFLSSARNWVLNGKAAVSRVSGSAAAIEHLQRSSQRYYQRPDAPHVRFDPARTSLVGFNGRLNLNRNSGLWTVNASLWGVSPDFESNDLGFMGTADRAGAHIVYHSRNVTPGRVIRDRGWWVSKWWTWNFGRQLQGDGVQGNFFATFLNYWSAGINGGVERRTKNDRLTRGGVAAADPAGGFWNLRLSTDSRRLLSVETFVNGSWNDGGNRARRGGVTLDVKPSSQLTISIGPEVSRTRNVAQFITSVDDETALATLGGRTVFGSISQTEVSMTTRVNVILSPTLSLQVYAQPLISAGDYSGFKELAAPRTFDFLEYGHSGSSIAFDPGTNRYTADPDGAPGLAPPLTFGNPDFNFKSLRVNAVFRWDLKPGSAFYLVWTRQQENSGPSGDFSFGRDTRNLLSAPGDDVILVKLAYWIGR